MNYTLGIRQWFYNRISVPNRDALFIFGLQKSGTSVIAGLLAGKTGKTVTIDTKYFWEPYQSMLIKGELQMKDLVQKYSYPFSKQIIKEPASTFFIDKVQEYFYLSKYVFIIRNPFQNIRSILNRLNLPGDRGTIDLEHVNPNWRYLFIEENGHNYIKALAKRWVLANGQLERIEHNACILVKYEDFNINKESFINELAEQLGFERKNSIANLVNKDFQPKGNPETDPKKFFGHRNYSLIYETCIDLIKYYGYH